MKAFRITLVTSPVPSVISSQGRRARLAWKGDEYSSSSSEEPASLKISS